MKKHALGTLLVVASFAIACSKSSGGGGDAGAPVAVPDGPTTFTMQQHVAASTEAFKCLYVQMPPQDGFIVGGEHEYTSGSHHLLLYRTDLTAIPSAQSGMVDCYEGAAGDMMSHIRGVVYAAETPNGATVLPSGVGLPYKGSDVFLMQTHYLDAGGSDLDATAKVHLDVVASGITTNASVLFFYAPFIDVPQGARASDGERCPIAKDIHLVEFASHYHARGIGYEAFLDPPGAPRATAPFYTSQSWSSPNIPSGEDVVVAAGSHVRFRCDYDNTRGSQEYVQGMSAANNEMCMFIGLYYPAMTDADDNCDGADEYGQGTTSCSATLSCLQACNDGPNDPATGAFTPCVQRCFVQSCPAATTPLLGALDCINKKCQAACGATDAGGGGQTCTDCVTANCLSEYEACAGAPCTQD